MTASDFIANFGAVIGYGILGSGALVTLAYWLFKMFSEKWLSAKFNERLETFKHEQQKELEQLRFKIGALMDRTLKLHQREFEVLPEAWSKMATAYAAVTGVSMGLQQYADVSAMSSSVLNEHLLDKDFNETTKEEIRHATGEKRNKIYIRNERWRRKNLAGAELFQMQEYLDKNGVFIRPAIKAKLLGMEAILRAAYVELEYNISNPEDHLPWNARKRLSDEGKALRSEIEKMVQERLWDSQESDA
jgi:hypothetical protein